MIQKKGKVSMSVIRRLPRYYRFLKELEKNGITRISSKELSERMGFTASQIRQDFNCFGGFGQQGYGYNVPQLCREIQNILGIQNQYPCILIGVGNLGRAITSHMPFSKLGFRLTGIFDNSPKVIGASISGYTVMDYENVEEFCRAETPIMAVLCVPGESAEAVADKLYELGVHAFWNFSHFDVAMKHPDAVVENVHMNDSMMTLCYRITSN